MGLPLGTTFDKNSKDLWTHTCDSAATCHFNFFIRENFNFSIEHSLNKIQPYLFHLGQILSNKVLITYPFFISSCNTKAPVFFNRSRALIEVFASLPYLFHFFPHTYSPILPSSKWFTAISSLNTSPRFLFGLWKNNQIATFLFLNKLPPDVFLALAKSGKSKLKE